MVEWIEKNIMKKLLDGWMDRKNRRMVGWIQKCMDRKKNGWMDGWLKQIDGWLELKQKYEINRWMDE